MFKNIILISMFLLLLISCGRKNDPKYEASLSNSVIIFNNSDKVFKMPKENEIYQKYIYY